MNDLPGSDGTPCPANEPKLTSFHGPQLPEVGPAEDAGLQLISHGVSNKAGFTQVVAHLRNCPRSGTAMFPDGVHEKDYIVKRNRKLVGALVVI